MRRSTATEIHEGDTMDLVPLIDEGLGNSAHLLDLGDNRALVDPSLDLRDGR